jgi:hypothetical protein
MANYKTGAQRYNDRMDKIFEKSEKLGHHSLHSSPKAKSKALAKKKEVAGKTPHWTKFTKPGLKDWHKEWKKEGRKGSFSEFVSNK